MAKLKNEISEIKRFIEFLEKTERVKKIDRYERTSKCIHVIEDFSSIAPENHRETIEHLSKVNKNYKNFREHALNCRRCQLSLESIFLFKGYENLSLFPEKVKKILDYEWRYNSEKGIYIGKLPAPSSGTFGPTNSRLVYITSLPIKKGIEEFIKRIQTPLALKHLSEFKIRRKKSAGGFNYFQADTYHKNPLYHTYISIRSRTKD